MRYFIVMFIARLVLILLCACAGAARAAPPPAMLPLSLIGDAEQAIAGGDDRNAEVLLSRIPAGSLDAMQFARVQIVRAEIGLHRHQPDTALRSLPPSDARVSALSPRIELLRGRAQFMSGDPVAAVHTLVARERGLTASPAIAENREEIWNGLVAAPLPASASTRIAAEEPIARGWLELAQVLGKGPTPSAVAAWTQRNPNHPAAVKAASVRTTMAVARPVPTATYAAPVVYAENPGGGYALLLPLSGARAAGGRAVRDGFVSAWFDSPEPRPAVRVYDAGNDAREAVLAYQAALHDGARFIVGPLTREGVAAIAAQPGAATWLALNYLDQPAATGVQFGLAPEDEARAAAFDAIASGYRSALALVPDNDWGARTLHAFSANFVEQGGVILQTASYASGTQDFGKPLRELLKLDRSNQRHQQITATLGVPSEFEPRPRQDGDLLFAPLRSSEARALVPQLAFFHATRLAAYTVSAALSANGGELEGMHLCDMPWMLDTNGRWAAVRERAGEAFADTLRDQPRLFALGMDAFLIAQALGRGEFGGGREVDGATGRLSLQAGGRVQRGLGCQAIRDDRSALSP